MAFGMKINKIIDKLNETEASNGENQLTNYDRTLYT